MPNLVCALGRGEPIRAREGGSGVADGSGAGVSASGNWSGAELRAAKGVLPGLRSRGGWGAGVSRKGFGKLLTGATVTVRAGPVRPLGPDNGSA